jgi:hypothetical protein
VSAQIRLLTHLIAWKVGRGSKRKIATKISFGKESKTERWLPGCETACRLVGRGRGTGAVGGGRGSGGLSSGTDLLREFLAGFELTTATDDAPLGLEPDDADEEVEEADEDEEDAEKSSSSSSEGSSPKALRRFAGGGPRAPRCRP